MPSKWEVLGNDLLVFVLEITNTNHSLASFLQECLFFPCKLALPFPTESQLFIEESNFLALQQNMNIFQISQW